MAKGLQKGIPGWIVVILCLMMGGFAGKMMQMFSFSAPLFRDLLSFGLDSGHVDVIAFSFRVSFGMDFNLGTFLGGVIGVWLAR
jgi:hypothetical protein